MATVEYKVCDRCQEKINPHSRLLAKVHLPKVVKILWIVTGVSIDRQMELCGKCADELEKFLERKENKDEQIREY